ncbi:riboflavin biosynthesis protein VVA0006-like [Mercenaria mercenaria]|uniref:riboflavin biosynthesis protein VVA0006-like n=1 Tax=Mercenaria mercenaria TaxID=6596 RepID=UPI00234F21E7|nr:riboflavin biosynthesis protein VVA0006-like [Mercenaria mercenaria]
MVLTTTEEVLLLLKTNGYNENIRVTEDMIFFYGRETPFSNMYKSSFTDNSAVYVCSEQYFQFTKMMQCQEKDRAMCIMNTTSPYEMKRLGNMKSENFNAKQWGQQSTEVLFKANWLKFTQNENLTNLLLATGSKILVEANPRDNIWGIGMDMWNSNAIHPNKWNGRNRFGSILMDIRGWLRQSKSF